MKEFKQRIKLAEMARLLSRSTKQFRVDVHNYEIPCLRLCRTCLFDPEEVEQHLREYNQPITVFSSAKSSVPGTAKARRNAGAETNHFDRYKTLLGLV